MEKINDNMLEESKIYLKHFKEAVFLAVIFVIVSFFPINSFTKVDFIVIVLFFICVAIFSLIIYANMKKYSVIISKENIKITTIRGEKNINTEDICSISCFRGLKINKYTDKWIKVQIFRFKIVTQNETLSVYTRYKDEFLNILKNTRD